MPIPFSSIDAATIDTAIEELTRIGGRAPSVLSLARQLGLANTTFRRRYPGIVTRLRENAALDNINAPSALHTGNEIPRLRAHNRELAVNLELAISSIQRLSLDNRALRDQLEHLSTVTHLPRRR
ncbi:hypothetical protein CH299_28965 [Rhodococcus sp. 14-2686-1-2]|nr:MULTISPECIES: hypothetical protein [unclassified Rhodococcus (in: high G+C Gram-positive bacteria)]OZE92940.1 hypothetical protein CH301_28450 [Rhodococcus sp. 15-1189-1-1a]OZF08194.1 hypothetical protein CH299_28965 [Rhodococcus sp. 14-2686-1-2]